MWGAGPLDPLLYIARPKMLIELIELIELTQ